jgi:hypothetical protein
MKFVILGSIAMLGLTGCAQLDRPLGECTNVVYHNEYTPQYMAIGALAGTAAMVVLSNGDVSGTEALLGAGVGAAAGAVSSGGFYTATVCPSMTQVLEGA